ncbi:hypothetical protein [Sulfuriflexus mobilis]|uniref:hypothetical protein n=1 Tax=Sulfuriflexus mobilis TaxID=1811807 RepID=UPI000F820816|nr:hypothetical protein [Sulfuriflexus mobilis]
MKTIRYLIMAMLFAAPVAAFSAGDDAMKLEKMIHDMEAHWQQVTNEKDDKRRQAMLEEHAKMMKDVEEATGKMSHSGHGMMHNHSANILDMHRTMMGSMK